MPYGQREEAASGGLWPMEGVARNATARWIKLTLLGPPRQAGQCVIHCSGGARESDQEIECRRAAYDHRRRQLITLDPKEAGELGVEFALEELPTYQAEAETMHPVIIRPVRKANTTTPERTE